MNELGESVLLLVSNRHVLSESSQSIQLNFTSREKDSYSPELGKVHIIKGTDYSNLYYPHPDPDIDLACINLSFIDSQGLDIYYRNISPSMIYNFDSNMLKAGSEAWFVGYPENRFDINNNLPILRKGSIASIPRIDFNNRKEFLIDAQVFKGSSGSPVFSIIDDEYKLICIISQTMVLHTEIEEAKYNEGKSLSVEQILGLGIVIKSTLLKELIDGLVKEIVKARLSTSY